MRRFRSRRATGYVALVLAFAVAAVVVVASAQAAPVKKKFDGYVVAANKDSTSFVVTLVNDSTSQQTLGSADFSAPGLTISSIAPTPVASSAGHNWTVCTGSGGSTCNDAPNNVVEFRAMTSGDGLAPGESVSFTVTRADGTCSSATWVANAKQSNDYSGTNNVFNIAANDLTPLGSLVFDPIQTGPPDITFDVPQIKTNVAAPISITAYDTCRSVDKDYPNYRDGSTPTLSPVTGLQAPGATFSALNWSNGIGTATVTPTVVEVGDQIQIADSENGISATSTSTGGKATFDVVQKICAGGGSVCQWPDPGNNKINATSTVPGDNNGHASLGLGYKGFRAGVTCSGKGPLGDSIQIDPYQYTSNYTVVITYAKSIVPNGPASGFITCKSTDDGVTWDPTLIPPCPNTPAAPCAQSQKTPGGNLQITLYLRPGDPHSGGFGP